MSGTGKMIAIAKVFGGGGGGVDPTALINDNAGAGTKNRTWSADKLTSEFSRVPEASSTDGSYILQATIASGVPTYSWAALSSLSGVMF